MLYGCASIRGVGRFRSFCPDYSQPGAGLPHTVRPRAAPLPSTAALPNFWASGGMAPIRRHMDGRRTTC